MLEVRLFDPCPFLNDLMRVLMEEKGYAAAFDHLMSERRNVTRSSTGHFDQCDELCLEIQAKSAKRQELITSEFL